MAILENTSYLRIIPELCYIDDLVHVTFEQYYSENDRIKEKNRIVSFNQFCEQITYILNTNQRLIADDELWCRVNNAFNLIKVAFVQCNKNDVIIPTLESDIRMYFYNYGLKDEWYQDPIIKYPYRTVCCGVYNYEDLTTEFYYNKLKEVMNKNIIIDV